MLFQKKNIIHNFKTAKGFELLYKAYWEKVFAVCYNNIRQTEIAQEMTQDIFKSLWERREVLELNNMEHYLVKSAKMKVFEYYRNQTTRNKHLDCIHENYCDSSNCTEEDIAFSELVTELDLLVEKLPCQCQNVFLMSREKGMTNIEIAKKLNISTRAVEYHISKAVTFLKSQLTF